MEEVMSLTFKYIRVLQQQGVAEWMFEEVNSTCLLALQLCCIYSQRGDNYFQ